MITLHQEIQLTTTIEFGRAALVEARILWMTYFIFVYRRFELEEDSLASTKMRPHVTFSRKDAKVRHDRRHDPEWKPFECPFCSMVFTRIEGVRQHLIDVHSK